MGASQTPAERDAAATRRSYAFIRGVSVAAWLFVVGVVAAPTILVHASGTSADTFWVVTAVSGLALAGWLAFLGGLRRRDLARIPPAPPRFDPRSR